MEKQHLKRLGYGFSALVMALSAVTWVPSGSAFASDACGETVSNVAGIAGSTESVICLDGRVTISADTTLDLTGKTLRQEGTGAMFTIKNGATLTIDGGTFEPAENKPIIASDYDGTVVINDGVFITNGVAMFKAGNGTIYIRGGDFSAATTEGDLRQGATTVEITGGVFGYKVTPEDGYSAYLNGEAYEVANTVKYEAAELTDVKKTVSVAGTINLGSYDNVVMIGGRRYLPTVQITDATTGEEVSSDVASFQFGSSSHVLKVTLKASGKYTVTVTDATEVEQSVTLAAYDLFPADQTIWVKTGDTKTLDGILDAAWDTTYALAEGDETVNATLTDNGTDVTIEGETVGSDVYTFSKSVDGVAEPLTMTVTVNVVDAKDVVLKEGENALLTDIWGIEGDYNVDADTDDNDVAGFVNGRVYGFAAGTTTAHYTFNDGAPQDIEAEVYVYSGLSASEVTPTLAGEDVTVTVAEANEDAVIVVKKDGEAFDGYTKDGNTYTFNFEESGNYTITFEDTINGDIYDSKDVNFVIYDGLGDDETIYAEVDAEKTYEIAEGNGTVTVDAGDAEKVSAEIVDGKLNYSVSAAGEYEIVLTDTVEGEVVDTQTLTVKAFNQETEEISLYVGDEGTITAQATGATTNVETTDAEGAAVADFVTLKDSSTSEYDIDTTTAGVYTVKFYTNFDGEEVAYKVATVTVEEYPYSLEVTTPDTAEVVAFPGEGGVEFAGTFYGELVVLVDDEPLAADKIEVGDGSFSLTLNFDEAGSHTVTFAINESEELVQSFTVKVPSFEELRIEKAVSVGESFTVDAEAGANVKVFDLSAPGDLVQSDVTEAEDDSSYYEANFDLAAPEAYEIVDNEDGTFTITFNEAGGYYVNIEGQDADLNIVATNVTAIVFNNENTSDAAVERVVREYMAAQNILDQKDWEELTEEEQAQVVAAEAELSRVFGNLSEGGFINAAQVLGAMVNGRVLDTEIVAEEAEEVPDEVRAAIEDELDISYLGNITYYDVYALVTADGEPIATLSELDDENTQVVIAGIEGPAAGFERKFVVVRYHRTGRYDENGEEIVEIDTIEDVDFDEVEGTLTFKSNKFSTYAVAYRDTLAAVATPDTGVATGGSVSVAANNAVAIVTAIAAVTLAGGAIFAKRK